MLKRMNPGCVQVWIYDYELQHCVSLTCSKPPAGPRHPGLWTLYVDHGIIVSDVVSELLYWIISGWTVDAYLHI